MRHLEQKTTPWVKNILPNFTKAGQMFVCPGVLRNAKAGIMLSNHLQFTARETNLLCHNFLVPVVVQIFSKQVLKESDIKGSAESVEATRRYAMAVDWANVRSRNILWDATADISDPQTSISHIVELLSNK